MPSNYPTSVDDLTLPTMDGAVSVAAKSPGQPGRRAKEFFTDLRDAIRGVQQYAVPKGALFVDARDFGLDEDGDNATAINAALAEAVTAGLDVRLHGGLWPIESPLSNSTGRVGLHGAGMIKTEIRAISSDAFVCAATYSDNMTMKCLTLRSDAGHAFSVPDGVTLTRGKFEQVQFYSRATAKSAINVVSSTSPSGVYDTSWDTCWIRKLTAAGMVPAVNIVVAGTRFNTNLMSNIRCEHTANGATVPFFYIEDTTDQTYTSGNLFQKLNMERCDGGYFDLRRSRGNTLSAVVGYDTPGTVLGHGVRLERSRGTVLINLDRRGGTLDTGVYDVYCDLAGTAEGARTADTTVVGQGSGLNMAYHFNDTPATVVGSGGGTFVGTAQMSDVGVT